MSWALPRLLIATGVSVATICGGFVLGTDDAWAQLTTPQPVVQPSAQPQGSAQNSASTTTYSKEWKKLGTPVDDDSKSMLDRYVFFDDATTDKNVTLSKPVLSHQDMEEWIKSHLGQIMTLDGRRFDAQLNANGPLFTPRGFADYVMYLRDANMKKFLADNQFKVQAYVEGTPEITTHGLRDDNVMLREKDPSVAPKLTYVWQANVNIVLSYLDYSNRPPPSLFPQKDPAQIINRFPVKARVELVRIPMQQDGELIAINRVRFATK